MYVCRLQLSTSWTEEVDRIQSSILILKADIGAEFVKFSYKMKDSKTSQKNLPSLNEL